MTTTKTDTHWALDQIVQLDIAQPGLAGDFLRASPERRQVVAAVLASPTTPEMPEVEMARLLRMGRHSELLSVGFQEVPGGFRSALGRSGNVIHSRRYYRYLHLLLREQRDRRTHLAIAQMPRLNHGRLRVLRILPDAIRTPRMVMLQRDAERAREMANLFQLFVENGVDAEALADALCKAETPRQLAACWKRWTERTRFPPPPVPESKCYVPILDAGSLGTVARSYRNCARRYLTDALDGRDAFGIFACADGETVVHLRRRDGGWLLDACHGRGNRPVSGLVRAAAEKHIAQYGIPAFKRSSRPSRKWDALREIAARWEFNHEDDIDWA